MNKCNRCGNYPCECEPQAEPVEQDIDGDVDTILDKLVDDAIDMDWTLRDWTLREGNRLIFKAKQTLDKLYENKFRRKIIDEKLSQAGTNLLAEPVKQDIDKEIIKLIDNLNHSQSVFDIDEQKKYLDKLYENKFRRKHYMEFSDKICKLLYERNKHSLGANLYKSDIESVLKEMENK
jgi:hypothetical protein